MVVAVTVRSVVARMDRWSFVETGAVVVGCFAEQVVVVAAAAAEEEVEAVGAAVVVDAEERN